MDNHPTEIGDSRPCPDEVQPGADAEVLTYRITDHLGQPVISWDGECDITAADLGAKLVAGGEHARAEAVEFLRDLLAAGRCCDRGEGASRSRG